MAQHLRLLIKRSIGKPSPQQPRLADPAKLETSTHPTNSIASCAPPRDAHPIFYGSEQDRKISLPPGASHPRESRPITKGVAQTQGISHLQDRHLEFSATLLVGDSEIAGYAAHGARFIKKGGLGRRCQAEEERERCLPRSSDLVVGSVPLDEPFDTDFNRRIGFETHIFYQVIHISIGLRHITRL